MGLDLNISFDLPSDNAVQGFSQVASPCCPEKAVKLLKKSWKWDYKLEYERIHRCQVLSRDILEKIKATVCENPLPQVKSSFYASFLGKSVEQIFQIFMYFVFRLHPNLDDFGCSWQEFRKILYSLSEKCFSYASYITSGGALLGKDLQSFVMVARALEIKEIYKKTHHVFLHAQNSKLLIIPDLIKEFVRNLDPENCPHQFKFLRLPDTERSWDITKYSQADCYVNDGYGAAREDLISVDGYFFHKQAWESSIFFMKKNANIMGSNVFLLQDIIWHFCPDLDVETVRDFAYRIEDLTSNDASQIGNLFLMCVPKEVSSKVQYRAHPFGNPCCCHGADEDADVLQFLQEDQISEKALCHGCNETEDFIDHHIPQYRLFTPELKAENGVKIYLVPSDKAYRDNIKQQIAAIVNEILALRSNSLYTAELS